MSGYQTEATTSWTYCLYLPKAVAMAAGELSPAMPMAPCASSAWARCEGAGASDLEGEFAGASVGAMICGRTGSPVLGSTAGAGFGLGLGGAGLTAVSGFCSE